MADAPTTVAKLSGYFKERYAKALVDAKPKGLHFKNDIAFASRDQQPGNTFHQPVQLTHEHGFTYAAAGSGAFSLEDAEPGVTQDAQILGTQCLLKSQIDYETAARAQGGPRAFGRALDTVVENMHDSMSKRLELDIIYGQHGLGRVKSENGTTKVVTLEATDWAGGIWAGQENAFLDIASTSAATATIRTGTFKITSIDHVNRTLTFSGETATNIGNVVAGDVLYFNSQRTATAHNVFQGIHSLLSATTGTVLNINVANYSLWKANQYAVGGALTFAHINTAMARATDRGLDEDVNCYVNPEVWADLLDDEVAQRRHNEGGVARYKVGAEGIEFYSQTGSIMIKASRYVKQGYGYIIAPKLWQRIGATDVTFNLPDRGDEFFRHIEDKAGYELRAYSNQAIFTKALAKSVILTGITT